MVFYPLRNFFALLITAAALHQVALAQLARESLKNPVYRIDKAGITVSPVADPLPPASPSVSGTAPLNSIARAEGDAKGSDSNPPVEVASRQPITVAPAAEPTPTHILGCAVTDAKLHLAHIEKNIRDYTCDFVKRERVDGELLPAEHMAMKVRHRKIENGVVVVPFSVYMKFKAPNEQRNREILYVENCNGDKLLAKEGGARGKWLPSVWLKKESVFVMNTNRHPITDIGIQRLTERLIESAESNATADLCNIKYTRGAKVNGRSCSYLEVVREKRQAGPLGPNNVYLVQLFMDEELKIPVRYAAYDWPSRKGDRPVPLEEYTYQNIRLNSGLSDSDFDKDNPDYNF